MMKLVLVTEYKSMIVLNFANVEELIFHDRPLQKLLPADFFSLFEQWRLGIQFPALKQLGKHAVLDFINQLNEDHIEVLESYFQEKIVLERLNYNVVNHIKVPIGEFEACKALCEVVEFGYFSTWRDKDSLYITFWR